MHCSESSTNALYDVLSYAGSRVPVAPSPMDVLEGLADMGRANIGRIDVLADMCGLTSPARTKMAAKLQRHVGKLFAAVGVFAEYNSMIAQINF